MTNDHSCPTQFPFDNSNPKEDQSKRRIHVGTAPAPCWHRAGNSTPAEDLHNKNPSLALTGKISQEAPSRNKQSRADIMPMRIFAAKASWNGVPLRGRLLD